MNFIDVLNITGIKSLKYFISLKTLNLKLFREENEENSEV